ncbi:MAG: TrkA C-terminal domain-containing protein [Bacillota bacterium]|nr:TrkA C-terminal domain-containing protein [Bacillota bacterium]
MAIKRGEEIKVSPGAEDMIMEGDVLVAMGEDRQLEKLQNR